MRLFTLYHARHSQYKSTFDILRIDKPLTAYSSALLKSFSGNSLSIHMCKVSYLHIYLH